MSVLRYFNDLDSRLIDLASHFPVQYALAAFVFLTICLRKKIVSLAVLAGFLFLVNACVLMNSGESISAAENAGMPFKVYSTNVSIYNKDISRLKDELQKIKADVVLLLEVSPAHLNELKLLIDRFPYHIKHTSMGSHELGIALLSNFPILDHNIKILSEAGNAIIGATLEINKQKILFYGTHSQNPAYTEDFPERNQQFLDLAQQICRTSMPVIVAGDFNATPFSPIFRKVIKISGLKDSREGFGWQPSWPTYVPLLWLPIDHILVSSEIQVHNRATGSFIGSDHYPVFADLSIN
jgi:endonuclease/exonuclease/phosphatase (EEP) superfamily protein YafD